MKILHVLTSARAEGTPKLVLDWLSIDEHEQLVLFLTDSGELLNEFKAKAPVFTNTTFIPSLKTGLKITALVKRVCKEVEPDLVIAWPTGHSQWIHWGAHKAGVKKKITHIGNPPGETFFGRYIASALTFWMSCFLKVKFVACSTYVKKAYSQLLVVPNSVLFAVHNAINLNSFSVDLTAQKKESIMVATLERHKDHETLIEASSRYKKQIGEVHCYGNGSLRSHLENLIVEKKASVLLMGSSNTIPAELRKHKVFILSTTENEGFGTVLIEALASGCRIVATDVAATREVLEGGKWGLLVPPNNPKELAATVEKAINSEPLSEDELDNRKKYLKQFSVETMINKYMELANG
jgi:glycosyltransferase involved in cell wall biosynthesis